MEIDRSIKIEVFEGVYEPAEDSYLLIDAIDTNKCKKALDMGCGSGIVAIHLAKKCDTMAADINEIALKNTKHNARLNNVNIKVRKSDLFSNIDEKFDIIAFNPPYLPTKNEDISWDGGKGGIEVLSSFLKDAWKYLNENGRIYFIASSLSDIDKILEFPYKFKKIKEKAFFFERIFAYEAIPVQKKVEDRK